MVLLLILSWVALCLSRLSTLLLLLPFFLHLVPHFLCVRTFDANVFDINDHPFEQSVLKVLGFSVVTSFSLSLSLSLYHMPKENLGKTETSVQLSLLLQSPATSQHLSIYTCKSVMPDIVPRVNTRATNKPSTTSLLI